MNTRVRGIILKARMKTANQVPNMITNTHLSPAACVKLPSPVGEEHKRRLQDRFATVLTQTLIAFLGAGHNDEFGKRCS